MSVSGDSVLTFICIGCQSSLTVPSSQAGIRGPCPICAQIITAPLTDDSPVRVRRPGGSPPRRVDGPPEKSSLFVKMGVGLFLLLVASPVMILGAMLVDMKMMYDDKQGRNESSEEYHLINVIEQIVHPKDPKWQQQGGPDVTRGAILLEGARIRHQDEVETSKPFDISTIMGGGIKRR